MSVLKFLIGIGDALHGGDFLPDHLFHPDTEVDARHAAPDAVADEAQNNFVVINRDQSRSPAMLREHRLECLQDFLHGFYHLFRFLGHRDYL